MSNRIDIIGIDKDKRENGTMLYIIDGCKTKKAKMYYKPVKSWNQYFSGKYGLYFIARFSNGTQKRVYLTELPAYR